jgi:hypothetical protein
MTINIVFNKVGYSISFGDSAISDCVYWFSITKEFYEKKEVIHANWICGYFTRKQFRKPKTKTNTL